MAKNPDTGIAPSTRPAGSLTPAFALPDNNDADTAGLPIFTNPVEGHTDTTSTHSGDLGGTAR